MKTKIFPSILIFFILLISFPTFGQSPIEQIKLPSPPELPSLSELPPLPELPYLPEFLENFPTTPIKPEQDQKKRLWGDYISEDINITIPGKTGMTIRIEHSFGDIDVRTGTNNQISITGEKRVSSGNEKSAQEFLEEMELRIEEKPNIVEIRTHYPDERDRDRVKNFSISYKIEIPENTDLQIENSFGDIDLRSVSGSFTISNSFGKLTAEDLTGLTHLKNKFGELTAKTVNGDANITNEHGSLNITNVTGDLNANNRFGEISIYNVKGTSIISGGYGKMTIEELGNKAELANSFGSIICRDIYGETQIHNSHGKVEAENMQGNTEIINQFGSVEAITINGDLYVKNGHSLVKVEDITGSVEVSNSFSPVNIKNIGGSVIVENRHGNITVDDILKKESSQERLVKLETSFGIINLTITERTSASISAKTTFGKIDCFFPVYLKSTSSNALKISGKLGDEKDKIEIEGQNTSIYIKKY